MDITTITSFRAARTRTELALAPGEAFIAGGTWLMSEPQPDTTGFVDLTTLGWPEIEVDADGLRIGATCTIARLLAWSEGRAPDLPAVPADWRATAMIPDAANALLASFKIWNTATVGGNLCRTFAAGAMISFAAGLDGSVLVWTPDGGEYRMPVAEFATGNGTNVLRPGEVLRRIDIPAHALRSRARLQKIALAELGRSGAVVTGRVDADDTATFVLTAATAAPTVLRFPQLPDAATLAASIDAVTGYYTDPLGAADWRRAVSGELAARIRAELEASA
ncbi:FAD binding domain-containing protein [Microbacterium sp. NPDC089189]|uniref:FAD binding domain-containing protein n=1 Tax=Microbacterium sp. NPDC089189 TaxID=3154972 RepID=UPI00343BE3B8